jgi:hypothetical protein
MLQSNLTFVHLYFVIKKTNYTSSDSKLRQPLVYINELVKKCYLNISFVKYRSLNSPEMFPLYFYCWKCLQVFKHPNRACTEKRRER